MFRNAVCLMLLPAVCLALVCCSDPYKSESYDSDQKNTGDVDPKDSETETETGEDVTSPRTPWDWTGIISTGGSLAVGDQGTPVQSTSQPYNNKMLSLGGVEMPPFNHNNSALSVVPLVEPHRALGPGEPSAYPDNLYGETPHSAMANQITAMVMAEFGQDYITVHTAVGESSQPMTEIQKGAIDKNTRGRAYEASLFEARAIHRIADDLHKDYGVGAVVIIHGEADATRSRYYDDLEKMWRDYNSDLASITRQSQSIPLIVSQQHSAPMEVDSRSVGAKAQWEAGVKHFGDILCTPKYHLEYADGARLTTRGYRWLGEKLGQIYYQKVVLGLDWQPLQPVDIEREDNVIRLRFNVPKPPLRFDDTLPTPHQGTSEWASGKGFEVIKNTDKVDIENVEIVGGDTVVITCRDLPLSGAIVSYAMYAEAEIPDGGTYRSGLLRDSDPFAGAITGKAQPNYCVAFEMAVP